MSEPLVTYALADGVARIALNDPKRLNAISEEMGGVLLDCLRKAAGEARAVIVTGEGKAFCSGANLDDAVELLKDPEPDGGGQLERVFNPAVLAMRDMDQPVITAIRGVTAGVGCGIAMAGDLIVCSETAFFFHAFSKVGLVPDGGSSWLLSRAIGRVRAMRLMLLGERLGAQQAFEWGLVSQVVPDAELDSTVMDLAKALAKGPKSLATIKRLAWQGLESDLETALAAERIGQGNATKTQDFREGTQAFFDRREPRFTGN